jgi:copper chaperone NosL
MLALLICFIPINAQTGRSPVKPTEKDKCPVCGMFVAKYPGFLAEILFKDGSYAVFDGAKDMFRYYFDLKKYQPAKDLADIEAVFVTGYYNLKMIDGREAYYVIGSDVLGPMGKELIPLASETEARTFMTDHSGRTMLRFADITPDIIRNID